ncbi:hypothetical protein GRJ2_001416000 [Grus japonensis]|uniref:Uncharacterized protein n=1 Tax=Grus japonensis TaxID=30415 RepID=A0ABC9WYB6_GRUJA
MAAAASPSRSLPFRSYEEYLESRVTARDRHYLKIPVTLGLRYAFCRDVESGTLARSLFCSSVFACPEFRCAYEKRSDGELNGSRYRSEAWVLACA